MQANLVQMILRLIHILSGVFWAGATFFLVSYLGPSVRAAGPEGGKVMQQLLARTRFIAAVITASTLTGLSGLLLYYRDSGGFQSAWITSPTGLALTIGGLFGLAAYLHGAFAIGRANLKSAAIARQLLASGAPPSPEQAQELQRQAAVVARNGPVLAFLLAASLIGMAIARNL